MRKYLVFLGAFMFMISIVALPLAWGQPLSMGRIGLSGKAIVKAGKGLVFQSPKDAEAPLMRGAAVETRGGGQALFDWTGKGTMALSENGGAVVYGDGLALSKGTLAIRLNPGQEVTIKSMGYTFQVQAPHDANGIAKFIAEGGKVKVVSETTVIKGESIDDPAKLSAGQSGTFGGSTAASAGGAPAFLGPVAIAGGAVAGSIAVAASASNKGGGPTASPSTP